MRAGGGGRRGAGVPRAPQSVAGWAGATGPASGAVWDTGEAGAAGPWGSGDGLPGHGLRPRLGGTRSLQFRPAQESHGEGAALTQEGGTARCRGRSRGGQVGWRRSLASGAAAGKAPARARGRGRDIARRERGFGTHQAPRGPRAAPTCRERPCLSCLRSPLVSKSAGDEAAWGTRGYGGVRRNARQGWRRPQN